MNEDREWCYACLGAGHGADVWPCEICLGKGWTEPLDFGRLPRHAAP